MTIEVHNETETAVDTDHFVRLSNHVLSSLHVNVESELSIIFVDEETIRSLNKQWMGEDYATDVLSFPMDELKPGRPDAQTTAGMLGDIMVCPDVAQVQAVAAGHDLNSELDILVTHGILHLLGFDHATPLEEEEMFQLQGHLIETFNHG